jgi:predicted nicotinamide N-methyase
MLALPYKRFIYKFDGDFLVSNTAVTLASPQEIRSPDRATDGDTGCAVWDAAVFLVRFLEGNPKYVTNKRVLELGCGLGLCGISCASIGAHHVTLTDMDYILQSTQRNVLANKVEKQAAVCCLDWLDPEMAVIEWNQIDIIIASDVIWLEHLIAPFVQTLVFTSKRNPNVIILMSNQRRSDMVWDQFISSASSHFTITRLSSDASLEIHCLSPR